MQVHYNFYARAAFLTATFQTVSNSVQDGVLLFFNVSYLTTSFLFNIIYAHNNSFLQGKHLTGKQKNCMKKLIFPDSNSIKTNSTMLNIKFNCLQFIEWIHLIFKLPPESKNKPDEHTI